MPRHASAPPQLMPNTLKWLCYSLWAPYQALEDIEIVEINNRTAMVLLCPIPTIQGQIQGEGPGGMEENCRKCFHWLVSELKQLRSTLSYLFWGQIQESRKGGGGGGGGGGGRGKKNTPKIQKGGLLKERGGGGGGHDRGQGLPLK